MIRFRSTVSPSIQVLFLSLSTQDSKIIVRFAKSHLEPRQLCFCILGVRLRESRHASGDEGVLLFHSGKVLQGKPELASAATWQKNHTHARVHVCKMEADFMLQEAGVPCKCH